MKVGFTPRETYHMFRSLRREVFNYFDYPHLLSFGVRPERSGLFNPGTLAHCDFSNDPDTPSTPWETANALASGIRVNGDYLPHLYEDEMIVILLHELTHATAGFRAGHGPEWQQQVRAVGSIPSPVFLIRNWEKMYPEGHTNHSWAKNQLGPTMDVFVGSL